MQTPLIIIIIIIRSVGFGLLTAVLCGLAWKTSFAEVSPGWWGPNERAILESMPHGLRLSPYNIAYYNTPTTLPMPPTALIPTNWEPNSQLIPTEITAQTLPVQRSLFSMDSPLPNEAEHFYLNRQVRILARRPPTTTIQLPAESAFKSRRTPSTVRPRVTQSSRVATLPQSSAVRLQQWKPQTTEEAIPQQE